MKKAKRTFQVFAKPAGFSCNLACDYCYYLENNQFYPRVKQPRMSQKTLEAYIKQHIECSIDPVITFSWHGGEPTLMGLEYYETIVAIQKKHKPPNQTISNAIQTNGTLIDDKWCEFLSREGIVIGLSLDGPAAVHDRFRLSAGKRPTFKKVINAYQLLKKHDVYCDILCVLNSVNIQHPLALYRFFKDLNAPYLTFLPLVEPDNNNPERVSSRTLPADSFGTFLCSIFDEWKIHDIESIKINIFEETARTAFGQEQALCIFRKSCGDIPVVEYNGDFFCCDHFVGNQHLLGNIHQTPLVDLLESPRQRGFGKAKQEALPQYCLQCDVLDMCNGGCPKDRFLKTPAGEPGLNYLCKGFKSFFTHFRPFVEELSSLWQQQESEIRVRSKTGHPIDSRSKTGHPIDSNKMKIGRNDPCPCGSGKKYKKCCLIK